MRKALIISVGTGAIAQGEIIDSLAVSISKSVKLTNADKTFFIVSKESIQTMLPRVLEETKLKPEDYETIQICDPNDMQETYGDLHAMFKQIRQEFDHVTIDYTSGTKAMTGALIAQGILHEADWLCYMSGKREKGQGTPIKGTEKQISLQPYFITSEHKIKTATQFFNKHQFDACLSILDEIKKQTSDPDITGKFTLLEKAAHAYSFWDKFRHEEATIHLNEIKDANVNTNKRFLNMLRKEKDKESYYIPDMINNAKRRGINEKKYDDAVARLYRTIELIAQYQLRTRHQIDTGKVNSEDLPTSLLEKWHIPPKSDKPLKIPMEKAYELLQAKGDKIGAEVTQDHELRDLLEKRNESILAHGQKPVSEETYTRLLKKTLEYALRVVPNLDTRMDDSAFPIWTV